MSKAFTKEQDQELEDDSLESSVPSLPQGAKNYISPGGAERLRTELRTLLDKTRPEVTAVVQWAASNGDRSENADYIYGKKRLREIDRRIRFLTKRLEAAEVVDPTQQTSDKIHFGATVTVENEEGDQKTYTIVGVDEIDVPKGRISWVSPLGKALLNHKPGESVTVKTPKGEEDYEILKVEYIAIE